jgi:hypothetical protein
LHNNQERVVVFDLRDLRLALGFGEQGS